MTREEKKELLFIDLSARLLYGVKVHLSRKHNRPEEDIVLNNIIVGKDYFVTSNIIGYNYLLSEIKPYLRPMSSMTDEERKEYNDIVKNTIEFYDCPKSENVCFFITPIDWLNAHHFDYRGLIEKGLALKAPAGMYKV